MLDKFIKAFIEGFIITLGITFIMVVGLLLLIGFILLFL